MHSPRCLKFKIKETIEFWLKSKNKNGPIFVPNACSTDIQETIDTYLNFKNSLTIKSCGGRVTIEKRYISTKTEDYTKTAEKIIEGVIKS